MADNVAVTAGSGVNIAADDVSSVYYQKVKLDGGGDGATIPLVAGRQADAASLPVALSTEDVALVGALTETAPGTDTASSGLNGRLQRIAQRITSLIALLPGALGAGGGLKVDGSGTALPVSGTVTAELSATDNAVLDSIDADLTTIIGHVDGIEALLGTIDADTGNIATAVQVMDDWDNAASDGASVSGDVAHDAADAGEPVKVGLKSLTAEPTAVAANDRANAMGDTLGRQVLLLGSLAEQRLSGKGTFTDTTAADIIAAQGSGVKIVVTTVKVVNAHATVGTKVEIRDGTTVKMQGYAAALGGGWVIHDSEGLFRTTANAALTARAVTTGADVDVFCSGYKSVL